MSEVIINVNKLASAYFNTMVCKLPEVKHLLIVGAGEGGFIEYYPYDNTNITCLDKSDSEEDGFSVCKQKYTDDRFTYVNSSCDNMSILPSNSFDMVVFNNVIEHLTLEQITNTMLEIKRVLKPTGFLNLSTPNKTVRKKLGNYLANEFHIEEFTADEIKDIVRLYGFEILNESAILSMNDDNQVFVGISDDVDNAYMLWFLLRNTKVNK